MAVCAALAFGWLWLGLACSSSGGKGASATGGATQTGGVTAAGSGGASAGGSSSVPAGSGGVPAASGSGGSGSGGAAMPPDAGAAASRDASVDAVAPPPRADASSPPPPQDGGGGLPGWNLVWSDEFDQDGAPDPASWRFETGFVRNMELQFYQPANATIAGGTLTIEGRRERVPNPNYLAGSGDWRRSRQFADYTSTSMTTAGKRTFTYGRFETRARIDVRTGSWPAFWTLGTSGGWPGGGEIDIMEFYAGRVLANVCKPAGSTCGWSSMTKAVSTLGAGWADQFHVWAMEWDATTILLTLDGVVMNRFNVADAVAAGAANPYVAKPVYIVLNLALGGTNGGDPTNTTFPMKFEVDYVRVYQRAP